MRWLIDAFSSYAYVPSSSCRVLLMIFDLGPINWTGPDQKCKVEEFKNPTSIFHQPPMQGNKAYDKPELT